MQCYEVTFRTLVSPARGELIIPFREVTVRKLQRASGDFKVVKEIISRRLRDYVTTSLARSVFFARLGATTDEEKKTLSVDALITFVFILLEMDDVHLFESHSLEEFVIDQSFLRLATESNIRLAQFQEFDHFTVQPVQPEVVPRAIKAHYDSIPSPSFFRVW